MGTNRIEEAIGEMPLAYATWSPGDGVTRYRFFYARVLDGRYNHHADYDGGGELATALGRKAALRWIEAFARGRASSGCSLK